MGFEPSDAEHPEVFEIHGDGISMAVAEVWRPKKWRCGEQLSW